MSSNLVLYNVMQDMVKNAVDSYLQSQTKSVCSCDVCRLDMMAFALNQLPPRYVVTREGEVFSKAKYLENQHRTDILSVVVRAASLVSGNPRH